MTPLEKYKAEIKAGKRVETKLTSALMRLMVRLFTVQRKALMEKLRHV